MMSKIEVTKIVFIRYRIKKYLIYDKNKIIIVILFIHFIRQTCYYLEELCIRKSTNDQLTF